MTFLRNTCVLYFVYNLVLAIPPNNITCNGSRGLIVDTDGGADDVMAISLLLKAEAAGRPSSWGRVVGITTATGNTGANNATRNIKILLSMLSRKEVAVYQGSEDGIVSHPHSSHFFGYDGLGDFLPPPEPKTIKPSDTHPALYIANNINRYPRCITLVCLGPLTNLAMALNLNPNLLNEVNRIFIVGGSYKGGGNEKIGVEFNMYADPEAASYFFKKIPRSSSPSLVTLAPLETILELKIPISFRTSQLGRHNDSLTKFLNMAERIAIPKFGVYWECYDPSLAAVLLDRTVVERQRPAWVEVISQGPKGVMLASLAGRWNNVNLLTRLCRDNLTSIILDYLTDRIQSP